MTARGHSRSLRETKHVLLDHINFLKGNRFFFLSDLSVESIVNKAVRWIVGVEGVGVDSGPRDGEGVGGGHPATPCYALPHGPTALRSGGRGGAAA